MAPVLIELEKYPGEFCNLVCVTGQHREMLDQVLDLFVIRPDHDLKVMTPGQDLFDVTGKVLLGLKAILGVENPDLVLVHGDTTTAMVAALAAYYCRIPVGHVEAGLRTGNKYAPYPEEMNRAIAGVLADFHFAPTEAARQNLLRIGISDKAIFVTGNTVVDALISTVALLERTPDVRKRCEELFHFLDASRKLILVTGHRRENFGEGFGNICQALAGIARQCPETEIVYPVHLNPNVREPVQRLLGDMVGSGRVHLIDPVEYLHFVYLMYRSHIILTDSGGVQEEAPSLGKPVLVMRETTERMEAIKAGTARLVGTDRDKIVNETKRLLQDDQAYRLMSAAANPFGDGTAAANIVAAIRQHCLS